MANTYTLIAASTVGAGGAANIDFTSIPSTYTDLVLKLSARNSGAQYYGQLYFNGSTTGYSRRLLYGDGSSTGSLAASNEYTLVTNPTTSYTANTFGSFEIYIPNYAGSINKSYSIDAIIENNATTAYATMYAALWSNTAAINRITMVPNSPDTFVQYTTAYLYGVKNA
jgi:hypothetical protein